MFMQQQLRSEFGVIGDGLWACIYVVCMCACIYSVPEMSSSVIMTHGGLAIRLLPG